MCFKHGALFNPVVKNPSSYHHLHAEWLHHQPTYNSCSSQNRLAQLTWRLLRHALQVSPPGYWHLIGTPNCKQSPLPLLRHDGNGISTAVKRLSQSPCRFVTLASLLNSQPAAGGGQPTAQPLPGVGGTSHYTATVTRGTPAAGVALAQWRCEGSRLPPARSRLRSVTIFHAGADRHARTLQLRRHLIHHAHCTSRRHGGCPVHAVIITTGRNTCRLLCSVANDGFSLPGLAIQPPARIRRMVRWAGTPTTAPLYVCPDLSSIVDPGANRHAILRDGLFRGTTGVPASAIFLIQPQNSVWRQIHLTGTRFACASSTPATRLLSARPPWQSGFNGRRRARVPTTER